MTAIVDKVVTDKMDILLNVFDKMTMGRTFAKRVAKQINDI